MNKIKTYWDQFSGAYQMGAQRHRTYILNWMKRNGVKSFFDVGCGTGPLCEQNLAMKKPFKYKGTDYSFAMVREAKKLFPDSEFEIQDARKLIEPDESWDAVVLMHCLDHLDDYKAAIFHAARVSKKYVIIALWRNFVQDGTRLNNRNMMGKKEDEEPWEDTHLQEYSKDALQEEFDKNNLKTLKITTGSVINDPGKYNIVWVLEKK